MEDPPPVDQTLVNAVGIATTKEERADIINMEKFACMFRQYRLRLGLTQAEVGTALGRLYPSDCSQTTISRFESLSLSYKIMVTIRQQLVQWIKNHQGASGTAIDPAFLELINNIPANNLVSTQKEHAFPRRKRTHLDDVQKDILEAYYSGTTHPTIQKYQEIADLLDLDRDVVRCWFSNKRQKIRKAGKGQEQEDPVFASLKAVAEGKEVESNSTNNNNI